MKKKIFTSSYLGLESYLVEVEVDISRGLPMFSIVGMGDTAILESKFRVKAALKNSDYEIVPQKIVVNLSPAGIKKEGAQFDLPIALGIILEMKLLKDKKDIFKDYLFVGELSLDGEVKGVSGTINSVILAKDDVDTSEGEFPVLRFPVVEACRFHLSGGLVYPAVQVVVVVKKEIAGSLALAHKQGRLRIALQMVAVETCKVNVHQNIRVVHQERFLSVQKGACLFDASSGVEQHAAFVADVNLRAEVVVGTEEVDNLLPEVVDIDRYLVESCFLQPQYHPFQHGLSCYGNEGLGHVVRQGAQPGLAFCFFHITFS